MIRKKHYIILLILSIIFILALSVTSAAEDTNQTTSIEENNHTVSADIVEKDTGITTQTKKTATTYVNSQGTNTSSGTTKTSPTNLTTAIQKAANNDTIYLTTTATHDTYKFSSTINIAMLNPDLTNLTIVGESGKTITFDGQNNSGIFSITGITLTLKNINFVNLQTSGQSGSIYIYNSHLILDNCTIQNSNPSSSVSLIYSRYSTNTITNSIIQNNKLIGTAALIYADNGNIEITNSIIQNNVFTDYSGIYSRQSTLTINNSQFTNNIAKKKSPVISDDSSKIIITDSTFANNRGNDSGVFYIKNSKTSITSSTFTNNTSEHLGGVITQLHESTLTVKSSTFSKNTAAYDGGCIYSIQSNTTISSSTFTQNKARTGGALYLANNILDISQTIKNSVFTNNQATSKADAIYSNYNITITNNAFVSTSKNSWVIINPNYYYNMDENWWSTNTPDFYMITDNVIPDSWRIMTVTNKTNGNTNTITVQINKLSNSSTTANAMKARTVKYTADTGSFNETTQKITDAVTNTYTGNSTNVKVTVDNQQLTVNTKPNIYLSINNQTTTPGKAVIFRINANSAINTNVTLKVNNASMAITLTNGQATKKYIVPSTWNANNYTTTVTFSGNSVYAKTTATGYLYVEDTNLNITVVPIDSSDLSIKASSLPSAYDLRNNSLVTSVKEQSGSRSCWAFSSLASIESVLLRNTGVTYDFSENNMRNILKRNSEYGDGSLESDTGNNDLEPIGYLVGWYGPVNETLDQYVTSNIVSPQYDAEVHIQDVYIIPVRQSELDNNLIKQAVYNYGAVSTGIRSPTSTYSYSTSTVISHSVTIVGWDDNFPKEKFSTTPPGDGAFIIKNSWGNSSGDGGYYYISYYDQTIGSLCNKDDISNEQFNCVVLAENDDNYSNIYQYDTVVNKLETTSSYIGYKNVYTATRNENIAAVGTYFLLESDYELTIEVNGKKVHTQSGSISLTGYRTIRLNKFIQVNEGDEFTVTVLINSSKAGEQGILLHYSDIYYSPITYGQSYLAFDDDSEWMDLYEWECVSPVKVYTKDTAKVNSSVEEINYNITVTTTVKDSTAKANITYLLNGVQVKENSKLLVKTINGDTQIVTTFADSSKQSKSTVTVIYSSENYQVKQNLSTTNINLPYTTLTLTSTNPVYVGESVTISGQLTSGSTELKNSKIIITANNKNYTATTDSSGNYKLIITATTVGTNEITAKYPGSDTYSGSTTRTNYTVNKKSTTLTATSTTPVTIGDNVVISGKLTTGATAVTDANIVISLNNNKYTVTTTSSGNYKLTVATSVAGNNKASVSYAGDGTYLASSTSTTFTVDKKSTALTLTSTTPKSVGDNVTISGKLTTGTTAVTGASVVINVNNKNTTVKTDTSGNYKLVITTDIVGTNTVTVTYAGNGTYLTSSASTTFAVNKKSSTITATSTSNLAINDNVTISGKLTSESNAVSNAKLVINVNNKNTTVKTDSSGNYKLVTSASVLGSNTATVTYAGNSTYLSSATTTTFTVNKRTSTLAATSTSTVYYGDSVTITVKLVSGTEAIENAKVIINTNNKNTTVTTDANGKYKLTVAATTLGTNNVNVNYAGNGTYLASATTTTFTVSKKASSLTAESDSTGYIGDSLTISGILSTETEVIANAKVVINVNNKNTTVKTDSSGNYKLVTAASVLGSNTATVTYAGNRTYLASSTTTTFLVSKKASELTATSASAVYVGNNVTISGKLSTGTEAIANAKVVINLNNKNTTVITDSSGNYKLVTVTSILGSNTAKVTYAGNDTYLAASTTTKFTVKKKTSKITLNTINTVYVGDSITVSGKLTAANAAVSKAKIVITLNNKNYTATTDTSGNYKKAITITSKGKYTLKVTYAGSNSILNTSASTAFTAIKKTSYLTLTSAKSVYVGNSLAVYGNLTANGKPIANATLTITADGKSYTATTNKNGNYKITVSAQTAGKKNITAKYAGTNVYTASTNSTVFKAKQKVSVLSLTSAKSVYVGNSLAVYGNLTANGKPIVNATFTITADGKSYTATTNKNGNYKIIVSAQTAGKKTITAKYAGTNVYTASTNSTVFKAKQKVSVLSLTSAKSVYVGNSLAVYGNLTANGKPIVNATFTITADGKSYTATTNKNGNYKIIVSAQTAGKKTITAKYAGTNVYTASTNSTVFKAKQKVTLITIGSGKSAYVGDNVSVYGKLSVNGVGLAYAKVSVTVDGKTYNVTTTRYGNYKLNVSSLTAGTNTIKVSYAGTSVYAKSANTTTFQANKKTSVITVGSTKSVSVGSSVSVYGKLSVRDIGLSYANVTITVGSKKYVVTTSQYGNYNLKFTATTAGNQTITASYGGTKYYSTSKAVTTFVAKS